MDAMMQERKTSIRHRGLTINLKAIEAKTTLQVTGSKE